jgi:hypothetical protein
LGFRARPVARHTCGFSLALRVGPRTAG